MKTLLFIINPKAGRTAIKNELFTIIEIFSNAGYTVTTYPTKGPGDAEDYIAHLDKKFDMIVCAGGDGTLDNTVAGVMKLQNLIGEEIPIGYIPCGTTNDFARSLNISREPVEAARSIVNGIPCPVDVGHLNHHSFSYIAAFGAFTEISYSTPQNLKSMMGHSAYVLEAMKTMANLKTYRINAQLDEKTISEEYIYCQITNSLSVGGFPTLGTRHMSFCDGKFECLFIRRPKNAEDMNRIWDAFLTNDIDQDIFVYETASKITIDCEEEIPWTIDGEFGGNHSHAEVTIDNRAVSIILEDTSSYNNQVHYDANGREIRGVILPGLIGRWIEDRKALLEDHSENKE